MNTDKSRQEEIPQHDMQPDEGEYGIEQVFAKEEDLDEARKHSQYHFSQDQLEHKQDRFEKYEKSPDSP